MQGFVESTSAGFELKMALEGEPGSGKTYTALQIANELVDPADVWVIDSENGSSKKYKRFFPKFRQLVLQDFNPRTYQAALQHTVKQGSKLTIVDSFSHAWKECTKLADSIGNRPGKNRFTAWADVTPVWDGLVESVIRAPIHVIATMRVKTGYVIEEGKNGKQAPKAVGLESVTREGTAYEFDIVGRIDDMHTLRITKSRCHELSDKEFRMDGVAIARILKPWLENAEVGEAPVLFNANGATERPRSVPPPAGPSILDAESGLIREKWVKRIDSSSSAEELRGFLQAMKADYTNMTQEDVAYLRKAYTDQNDRLKNGAAAPQPEAAT